jgi:transcriptional regulator with XRE-family HTH domain
VSPMNVPAIGAYIREQREQARISLRQLAQAAGVSNPYLSQIERGLRKPSADILQQIAKGLRISAEALYVQAGFLEDRPLGQGVRDAVLTDPELSERQKQMLIEIYDSFRTETALAAQNAAQDAAGTAGPAEADEEIESARTGVDPAALAWPEEPTGWESEDLDAEEPAPRERASAAGPEPPGGAAAEHAGQGDVQAHPNVTAEPHHGSAETR